VALRNRSEGGGEYSGVLVQRKSIDVAGIDGLIGRRRKRRKAEYVVEP
jgi:hypothetical protein